MQEWRFPRKISQTGLELSLIKIVDISVLPLKASDGLCKANVVSTCFRRNIDCLIDAGFEFQGGIFYASSGNERPGGVIGQVNNRNCRFFGAVLFLGLLIIGAGVIPP